MSSGDVHKGPLSNLKVVEFAGLGPAPMCAMLLADLGATVLRIERTKPVELGTKRPLRYEVLLRGREPIALNLKSARGVSAALEIIADADMLVEGYRPGVMEKLGLGPEKCFKHNSRLVYGRMTGWGQDGPLSGAAGHDINYIAVTGALHATGRHGQPPAFPLNLLGDFGGGALYLTVGLLSAYLHAKSTGEGQVVDASIVDGTLSLMAMHYGSMAAGLWNMERGTNYVDSGAPFYDVYECADGKWVSVGAIESRFFNELMQKLGLDAAAVPDRLDPRNWQSLRSQLADQFKTKTQSEWCNILEGSDACFAPVLSMDDVRDHAHISFRKSLIERDGVIQPAVAPRLSKTPGAIGKEPRLVTRDVALQQLEQWFGKARYDQLRGIGVLDSVQGTEFS
ncbi:CaiB/BaiF CoA transferase family protein [Advenella kashmirensis]